MKILILTLVLLPGLVMAQKSVSEYTAAQRAALQVFITKNPNFQFIPETWFDEDTLKAAREEWGFGKKFKPYFQTGDFNKDGKRDFAVVLLTGKSSDDADSAMYVVIFNQTLSGKYNKAHVQKEDFSTALFINSEKNKLFVGVMETDSAGCFVPAGKGYIVEPCN